MSGKIRVAGALALAAILVQLWPGEASAQRRRSRGRSYYAAAAAKARQQAMIRAAEAQKAAAQQVLNAALMKGSSAQSQLDAAVFKLRATADEFRAAHSTAQQFQKQLNEIEQEILSGQAQDSPYAQAVVQLDAAKRALAATEAKVLAIPENVTALSGLAGTDLAKKRADLLELSGEYLSAKESLIAAGSEIDRVRRELFRADADWKSTSEALGQAHKEEREAEHKAAAEGPSQLAPSRDLRSAEKAAAAAQQSLAQAESVLSRLRPNSNKSGGSYSSSSSATTKKNKK